MENMNTAPLLKSAISKVMGKEVGYNGNQWLVKDEGVFIPLSTADLEKCVTQHAQDVKAHEDGIALAEAKKYLSDTDFKVLPDYDQDNEEIKVKRQEAREFIRANEVQP